MSSPAPERRIVEASGRLRSGDPVPPVQRITMASAEMLRQELSDTDRNRRSASVCDTTLYKPVPAPTKSSSLRPPLLAGDLLPRTRILLRGQGIYLRDFFLNRRGVLFGGPGAFTPTCSEEHLVGFRDQASQIKAAGIDFVGCIYANDPYVLRAWARAKKVQSEFTFISDVEGRLTSALGLLTKGRTRGLGVRPRRFALVIGLGGQVEWSQVDHHCYAEDVLKFLGVSPLPASMPPSSAGGDQSAAGAELSDDNSDNGDLNSDSATETGGEDTLEDFSSHEIVLGRWRSLMLGASVRVDDLTKVPLPTLSLGRGNANDGSVCLQYDSHPGQHTISHTSGCLRVSVEIGHGMEGFGLLRFDGRMYVATEFHVVGPSPHVLDERAAFPRPIELRIVHQALPGCKDSNRSQLLVLAVTFSPPPLTASERDNVLAINPFLHQVLEIPTLAPDVYEVFLIGQRALPGAGGFGLSSLVPHDSSFIKYRGVLSALGERVIWIVMKQSLSLSRMQLQALEQYVRTPASCPDTPADALALSHVYRFLPKLSNIRAATGGVIIDALRKKLYIMDQLQETLSSSVLRGVASTTETNKWLFAYRQKILEHERELADLKGLVDRALDVYKIGPVEIDEMFEQIASQGSMYLSRFLCPDDVRRLIDGVRSAERDDSAKCLSRATTAPIGSIDAIYKAHLAQSEEEDSPSHHKKYNSKPLNARVLRSPTSSETDTSSESDTSSTSTSETSSSVPPPLPKPRSAMKQRRLPVIESTESEVSTSFAESTDGSSETESSDEIVVVPKYRVPNLSKQPLKSALKSSKKKPPPQVAKFLTDERLDLVNFMIQQLKRSSSAESVDDVTTANTVANLKATQLSSSELATMEKQHRRQSHKQRITIRFQEDQSHRSSALDSDDNETDWGALDRKLSREIRLRRRKPTGHPNLGDQVAKMIHQMAQTKIRQASIGSSHSDGRHTPNPLTAKPLKGALKKSTRRRDSTTSESEPSRKPRKRVPVTSSEESSSSEELKLAARKIAVPTSSSMSSSSSSRKVEESSDQSVSDEGWRGQTPWERHNSPCSESSDTPPRLPLVRGSPTATRSALRESDEVSWKRKGSSPSRQTSPLCLNSTDRKAPTASPVAKTSPTAARRRNGMRSGGETEFGRLRGRMASMKTPITTDVEELRVGLGLM